jgi:hypothetical protein
LANNENQHYIPQFYLKQFSNNQDRLTVGVFNRKNDVFFAKAPIKGQASKKHFYGKDLIIENFFGKHEGQWARVIANITNEWNVLNRNSVEYSSLLTFLGTIAMRTPTAINLIQEQFELADKIISNKHPLTEPLSLNNLEAIRESFKMIIPVVKCLSDLDYKIIKNESAIPFITSDHPLVRYNKLYVSKKMKFSKTGFSTIGLIIFFPLSSNTMLILYDGGAYNIGPKRKSIFKITNKEEAKLLNTFQFINQKGQVYFDNRINETQIKALNNEYLNYDIANKPDIKGIEEKTTNQSKSTLLVFSSTEIKINFSFEWLKITEQARKLNLIDGKGYIRKNAYQGINT